MKKLGILLHQILNSQQFVSLNHNLNKISEIYPEIDPIVFYNDTVPQPLINQFALLQSVEALDYDGILIAADPVAVHFLPKCLCAAQKYFYVWNTDWFTNSHPALINKRIYLNSDIPLIARSESHAKLLSRVFKKPKHIIEDFDYEQLINQIVYPETVQ